MDLERKFGDMDLKLNILEADKSDIKTE